MEAEKRIEILERDSYSCRNRGCKYYETPGTKDSNLEVHHLVEKEKYKGNPDLKDELGYGMDNPTNLITLCTTCHRRYHCGVKILYIGNKKYEVTVTERFNWKHFKHEMKQIRRECRHDWGIKLMGEEIVILLYWLYVLSIK